MKKLMLSYLILGLVTIASLSCSGEPQESSCSVEQKIYSVQGIDSISTEVYFWEKGVFYGRRVYYKKGVYLNEHLTDSLDAVRFSEKYLKFNKE
jgi:hypothetical protein